MITFDCHMIAQSIRLIVKIDSASAIAKCDSEAGTVKRLSMRTKFCLP